MHEKHVETVMPTVLTTEDVFKFDLEGIYDEKPKICFLSGKARDVLGKGHSRFFCELIKENNVKTGPGYYDVEKITSSAAEVSKKVLSKVGYGGLARRAPRFSDQIKILEEPKITYKEVIHEHVFKQNKAPFNSSVPRKTGIADQKDVPGVGYDITRAYRDHSIKFHHSFGGRTVLRPHVYIKCTPENTDTCEKCEHKPEGDYWFRKNNYLCRKCMTEEWNRPQKLTRNQLQEYLKIRDCSLIHQHSSTTAAIPLMDSKDIRKQQVRECYFAAFAKLKCAQVFWWYKDCKWGRNIEEIITIWMPPFCGKQVQMLSLDFFLR